MVGFGDPIKARFMGMGEPATMRVGWKYLTKGGKVIAGSFPIRYDLALPGHKLHLAKVGVVKELNGSGEIFEIERLELHDLADSKIS